MATIGLLNGQLFDYENPDPAAIDLETMAHVLGGVPRFGGHTIRFVYLDEHSSRVGRFARFTAERSHPGDVRMHDLCELHGQLHDGHEVYTPWGDITDGKTDEMRAVEAGLDAAIFQRLGIEPPNEVIKEIVKQADKRALWIEARLWAPSSPRWTDLEPPLPSFVEPLLSLTWPRLGECWLRRTRELLAELAPGNQSSKALWANVAAAKEKAEEADLGREQVHFDPQAVAKGTFPTHIGPRGAHYGDGTVLAAGPRGHAGDLSPAVVDDFERFKRFAEARALLKANDWVEDGSGEWSPNTALGWAIDINRISPDILRALAVIAEEPAP
jgi:hypothetical protein